MTNLKIYLLLLWTNIVSLLIGDSCGIRVLDELRMVETLTTNYLYIVIVITIAKTLLESARSSFLLVTCWHLLCLNVIEEELVKEDQSNAKFHLMAGLILVSILHLLSKNWHVLFLWISLVITLAQAGCLCLSAWFTFDNDLMSHFCNFLPVMSGEE